MASIPIFLLDRSTPDECHNPGPCCFTCPHYDECEQHYDEENDDG
jgi:hypothetical protein